MSFDKLQSIISEMNKSSECMKENINAIISEISSMIKDPKAKTNSNNKIRVIIRYTVKGQEFVVHVDSFPFFIGRDSASVRLALPEKTVSRIHTKIVCQDGVVYLENLSKTNVTQVNGKSINAPIVINSGDRVTIGRCQLTFEIVQCANQSLDIGQAQPSDSDGLAMQKRYDIDAGDASESVLIFTEALRLYDDARQYLEKFIGANKRLCDYVMAYQAYDELLSVTALDNLATSYRDLGYYKTALELIEECYELKGKVLGEEHLDTLLTLSNLASTYRELNDYTKALELLEKCYDLYCKALGEEHPDTLTTLNDLAVTYGKLGDRKKELELTEKCYELHCKVLGEEHPNSFFESDIVYSGKTAFEELTNNNLPEIEVPDRMSVGGGKECRECGNALFTDMICCSYCGSKVNIEKPNLEITKVQFSAVAPKTLLKGDYTVVNIIMYEDAFRYVVDELLDQPEDPVKETKSGILKVHENSMIRICLESPDIDIEDNKETQQWQGDYLNFSFAVMLPESYRKRQILFIANVFVNDLIATKLKFTVKCSSFREQKVAVLREDILSAFVSYASQDRNRVVAIIQGMKKARPDMDVFFDVDSLRSGDDWEKTLKSEIEKRDILFLCWSNFARQSKWVDSEWRYALDYKGIECIEPIPIEPPNVCPPPEELKSKHFNDKLLYIIDAEREKTL